MAIFPGAIYQPINLGSNPARRQKGGRFILHVAVSNAQSLKPWNDNTWHFYVAKNGQIFQYVDTDYRAYCNRDANYEAVSVETAGGVTNADREPWTHEQLVSLAAIARWLHETEGIPLDLIPDSLKGRRGIGYHRQGIDPWRAPGGELWSASRGKICPGAGKIAQIPQMLDIARGGGRPAPPPAPPAQGGAYTVQPGDTLTRVALRFGTTVANLQAWNRLGSSTLIRVGQVLQVAGPEAPRTPIPPSIPPVPDLAPFPLPRGHYFGHKAGPNESHGGYHAGERPFVQAIQRVFIALGCVPGVHDWRSGWADGVWEDATSRAARVWFGDKDGRGQQQHTDRIYADDYAILTEQSRRM